MKYQKTKSLAVFLSIACFVAIIHFAYQGLFVSAIREQAAAILGNQKDKFPEIKQGVSNLETPAQVALSVFIAESGNSKALFEKNKNEKLLIASLTKLMTAVIVLENYNPDQKVTIDQQDVLQGGWLKAREEFSVNNLLYAMLINSDNSAAYALSKAKDRVWFVNLMNQKAKEWGMEDTYYSNSVGFGPDNKSTAQDLVKLAGQIIKEYPIIFEITKNAKYVIYDFAGNFHHTAYSTNEFWPQNLIGAKTGNNEIAGECLLLVVRSPNNEGYLINIILNSKGRFRDMQNLINFIYDNFNF